MDCRLYQKPHGLWLFESGGIVFRRGIWFMELERICRLLQQRGEQIIVTKNGVETYHESDEDYYRLERERLSKSEQWHYFYIRSRQAKLLEREHLATFSDECEGARTFYLWTMRSHYRQKYVHKIRAYLRDTDYDMSPDVATVERALGLFFAIAHTKTFV